VNRSRSLKALPCLMRFGAIPIDFNGTRLVHRASFTFLPPRPAGPISSKPPTDSASSSASADRRGSMPARRWDVPSRHRSRGDRRQKRDHPFAERLPQGNDRPRPKRRAAPEQQPLGPRPARAFTGNLRCVSHRSGRTPRRGLYCATVMRQAAALFMRPDPWPVAGRP
jgi:hypothetical protein